MPRQLSRPKVVVYRFVDVFITSGRLKFDYVNIVSDNLNDFLVEFWNQPELIEVVDQLREFSWLDYDRTEGLSPRVFKPAQPTAMIQSSLCLYLNWRMKEGNKARLGVSREAADTKLIRWVVAYSMGLDKGLITIHERYANALKQRQQQGVKQYVFSRMTRDLVDLHRRQLELTTQGDLSRHIDGYINSGIFSPIEEASYHAIASILALNPKDIMLITTKIEECDAASKAGYSVVKVKRPKESKGIPYPRVRDMSSFELVEPESVAALGQAIQNTLEVIKSVAKPKSSSKTILTTSTKSKSIKKIEPKEPKQKSKYDSSSKVASKKSVKSNKSIKLPSSSKSSQKSSKVEILPTKERIKTASKVSSPRASKSIGYRSPSLESLSKSVISVFDRQDSEPINISTKTHNTKTKGAKEPKNKDDNKKNK